MPDYDKIKKYYDDYGNWYDDERIEGYYKFINDIEIRTIEKLGSGKSLLEIGCGTGIILNRTSAFASNARGIDLSSGMLKEAKKKKLSVIEANATNIPFPNKSIDIVYSFKVLSHIPEIQKVIMEIHRVLKDDGISVLEFYNPLSTKYVANYLAKSNEKVFTRFYTVGDIKKLTKGLFLIHNIVGARIFTFHSTLLRIPFISRILVYMENIASNSPFSRIAGYQIFILKKRPIKDQR